jgi:hypothetical protein
MTPAQERIMDAVEAAPEGVGVCFDGRSLAPSKALLDLGLVEREVEYCAALRQGGGLHRATRIRLWRKGAAYPERDEWPNGIPWWQA